MVTKLINKSKKYIIGILINTKPGVPLSHSIDLLTAEIKKVGHTPILIYPPAIDICIRRGVVHLTGIPTPWPPDVIINRHDIVSVTEHDVQVVREIENKGIPVVNNVKYALVIHDKFFTNSILINHGLPIPPMARIANTNNLKDIVDMLGGFPIIMKANKSNQGKGVVKVSSMEELRSLIDFVKNSTIPEDVFLQSFIQEATEKCIRVVVVDNKIVTAYGRSATNNDFRASLAKGSFLGFVKLSKKESDIFQQISKILNLDIIGLDFARTPRGPQIIEVNAYPGLGKLYDYTGYNMAPCIIKATIHKISQFQHTNHEH